MKSLQRLVVIALLGVWFFPAVSQATPLATPSTEVAKRPASSETSTPTPTAATTETGALAAREKQAPDLQNFKGGDAVIYIGGGGLLIVLLVLIIIL